MKTCFGYVRVSTEKQGEGVSLTAQKEAIAQFAAKKGLVISKWWEEKQSAAKAGRPIFNEMMARLKRREADGLVIHKIDRSIRNYHDWAVVDDLINAGIEFHIATESFDFNTLGGRMAADFMAVVATNYIRNLQAEIKKGQQGLLKQGHYPFAAPIGYCDHGRGKLKTPDPIRAPLIREAYEMYDSGEYSLRGLLQAITELGLTNKQGRPLSLCGLETVLNNPFYCGLIHIKRTGKSYQGQHQPIISAALYKRVQKRKKDRCGKKVTRHNHLFRGLFRCGYCNRPMVPELQKARVYYRCKLRGCETTTLREDQIEPEIRKRLGQVALTRTDVRRASEAIRTWVEDQKAESISANNSALQLAKIGAQKNRIADLLIAGTLDEETYNSKKAELLLEEKRCEELRQEKQDLAAKAENFATMAELLISVDTAYDLANRYEKRKLLKMVSPNSLILGKKLEFATSDWVDWVRNLVTVLCGAQRRDTGRTIAQTFDNLPQFKEIDVPLEPVEPAYLKTYLDEVLRAANDSALFDDKKKPAA